MKTLATRRQSIAHSVTGGYGRTTATLLLVQLGVALGAVLTNFLSAQALGPSGRGLLALWIQISYIGTLLLTLGIERPYLAWRARPFRTAVLDQLLLLRPTRLALPIAFAGAMAAAPVILGMTPALALMASLLFVAGNLCVRVARVAFIASSRPKGYLLSALLPQALMASVAVALVAENVQAPVVWFSTYAFAFIPTIVLLSLWGAGKSAEPLDKFKVRQLRMAGLRLMLGQVGGTALLRADRLLLPFLGSPAQLGIYIVVAAVMELAVWPAQNFADALLREIGDWRTLRRYVYLLAFTGVLTFAIAVCCGVSVLFVVNELLPPSFSGAAALIPVLVVNSTVIAVVRVVMVSLIALRRHTVVTTLEVAGLASGVATFAVLIPSHGALGAAYGSLLAQIALLTASLLALVWSIYSRSYSVDEAA